MRILLTGATGFLGSYLARALLLDKHEVIAIKRKNSNLFRLNDIKSKIRFYDLDGLNLRVPFEESGPIDAVIHAATCYGRNCETVKEIYEANTAFPLRLLNSASCFGVSFFFNTDTFFNTKKVPANALSPYALSKKTFLQLASRRRRNVLPKIVNIRLEHLYGPRDNPTKFVPWIIWQCLQSVPIIDLTSGRQKRDFIHVDDAVAAYLVLLESSGLVNANYTEVGVGSGQPITLKSFVERVHFLSSSKSRLHFGSLIQSEVEIASSAADIGFLSSLGWRPAVSLDSGIHSVISDFVGVNKIKPGVFKNLR